MIIVSALVYEILYQKVFSELDRRDNLARSPRGNPLPDLNNMSYYQNGLMEDESLKDDTEDNSGWTEVRSRSSKGDNLYLKQQLARSRWVEENIQCTRVA